MVIDQSQISIANVRPDNIGDHPNAICFINPKHENYSLKVDWFKEQYALGLRIKLLYLEGEKKAIGFIEYVPGDHCWRGVNAKGVMFIHCLWTNGKKHQRQGLGGMLLKEVEKDMQGNIGIATMVSESAFMAKQDIFLKNGFTIHESKGKDHLLVKDLTEAATVNFSNYENVLKKYQKLSFIYSKQCPWVARFIEEVKPTLKELQLEVDVIEINSAKDAQQAPSAYAVLNIVYKGKLLTDRYISVTRFNNIIKKELL